jgi:hypothetical protein
MGRVIHVRVFGLDPVRRPDFQTELAALASERQWRHERPWLADAQSTDLFQMEYFRHAVTESLLIDPEDGSLSAAGFLKLKGDETDALALVFILRHLSETFGVTVRLNDPDNPIAKMRRIQLVAGRLPDGAALEEILVRRPIFKKLPNGFRIEMFPPRALGSAFGTAEADDTERRAWAFHIHGMRGSAPTFFEAEAEAMRIYNGLRFLE